MSPSISSPLRSGIVRAQDVVEKLHTLLPFCRAAEQGCLTAMSRVSDEKERIQFVGFWQEHAKITSELENKIRWLGGNFPKGYEARSLKALHIKSDASEEERLDILQQYAATDAALFGEYERLLQTSLPVDVRVLLQSHLTRIKTMWEHVVRRQLVRYLATSPNPIPRVF